MLSTLNRIRQPLQRVTSNGRFIPAIDGLRCIAVLWVVVFHMNIYVLAKSTAFAADDAAGSYVQKIADCGHYGVQLFFVISGLVLGLPFAEHYLKGRARVSLRAYFSRRIFRIEPPYVINLVILFVLLVVAKSESIATLSPHLGASLAYLHNVVYRDSSWINRAAWSLEVEVQFYVLAPLLALVFAIRRTALRRSVILGAMALLGVLKSAPHDFRLHVPITLLSFLDFFLAGFFLADVYTTTWNARPTQKASWDALALLAWCAVIGVHFYAPAEPFLAFVILVACAASFRGKWVHGALSTGWAPTIGGMCYTIYLYHYHIISAVGRWTIGIPASPSYAANLALQTLLNLPPILAGSAVLFLVFEKPFMVRDWPLRWKSAVLSVLRLSGGASESKTGHTTAQVAPAERPAAPAVDTEPAKRAA
jgi:peptidoglycan/LPS O-acetylase OafA/YrhL